MLRKYVLAQHMLLQTAQAAKRTSLWTNSAFHSVLIRLTLNVCLNFLVFLFYAQVELLLQGHLFSCYLAFLTPGILVFVEVPVRLDP